MCGLEYRLTVLISVIRAVLSLKWLHQTGEAGLAG